MKLTVLLAIPVLISHFAMADLFCDNLARAGIDRTDKPFAVFEQFGDRLFVHLNTHPRFYSESDCNTYLEQLSKIDSDPSNYESKLNTVVFD